MPVHQNKRVALHFAPVIALYAGLAAGTAGIYTSANLPLLSNFTSRPLLDIRHARERRTASLQPALSRIRSIFGLTMTEFAQIFDVSRPAAYAWFDGSLPKPDVLDRIWKLHAFADQLEQMQIQRVSLLKRRPLIQGATLLDILKEQKHIGEALVLLQEAANHESAKALSIIRSPRPRIHTIEDVSLTPHADS